MFYSFKRQPHKMLNHTQTILQVLSTNCLSMFGHFVGLALKGLSNEAGGEGLSELNEM